MYNISLKALLLVVCNV